MMKNPVETKDFFASIMVRLHYCSGPLKLILLFFLLKGPSVYAQVGVHTDFPDASSAMDIYATNKGLLIPRVTLGENLDDPTPVSSPATGLLVFNTGSNQDMGFYYWDGSLWVPVAGTGGGSDSWSLSGNSGTEVGTNFIGTTDAVDFATYTNALERMRVVSNGQVVIDSTAARNSKALFSVFANATQDYAINAYSSNVGVYADAGVYGMRPQVNNSAGTPLYTKNLSSTGYGAWTVGSNQSAGYWSSRSAGLCSRGNDGIQSWGLSAGGIGITAMGNGLNPALIADGAGGTFVGYFGLYARSTNASANGTGIIGLGNNLTSSTFLVGGSGGAFTGVDGVYGKSISSTGTGVIGLGNNIASAPPVLAAGSGGAFKGTSNGAAGWGGDYGLIGWGLTAASGTGVVGAGNNLGTATLPGGSGGAFVGTAVGTATWATSSTGTGIAAGGNGEAANVYTSVGSGGAFSGTLAGSVSWGTDATDGVGVIGAGNNASPSIPSGGCGGAFTGITCGGYAYATNSSGVRSGGYYATAPTSGGAYAYVAYRSSSPDRNYKVYGNGTVSTIVKNIKGELITLSCPEAPEVVFQDFGIGQLAGGKAHITIDPDLAININVSDNHPLKVYITPEGDCNGVYVTNKSAQGFDVIELQGGKSNISFAWQIVATRANEEYTLKDGSKEISDYSDRFAPAPGPLEMVKQPEQTTKQNSADAQLQESVKTAERAAGELHESKEGAIIEVIDDPDEK